MGPRDGDSAISDARDDDASSDDGAVGDANDASSNGCVPNDSEFCPESCPETCNSVDDDCDNLVDEEPDLDRSICTLTDATSVCASGECLIVSCNDGAANCDSLDANGCEVRVDTPERCGSCNRACNFPGASARCFEGTCLFDECLPGFGNCDGQPDNGCELRLDSLAHCGGCNVVCGNVARGQPGCIDGVCGVAECDVGFGNCDDDPDNGCETPVDTLQACGSCSTMCAFDHAEPLCAAQSCVAGTCLNGFGDCDGDPLNECEATLAIDPDNCGACGHACDTDGTSGSAYQCVAGQCVVTTCATGFADCDSDANNGCETSLRTLTDCGGCGLSCAFAEASASCATGTCAFAACHPGFGNCNTRLNDGCETPLDTDANCGACAATCGVSDNRTCSGGVCSLASCATGTADCDNDGTTCEQQLNTRTHCGACNARCGDTQGRLANASATCSTGTCAIGSCDASFANCDNAAVNGCETSLRTASDCGACGTACSRPNATSSCASGTCTTTACNTGFGDCDGNVGNGCETNTNTNQHCSACNTACSRPNAMTSCASGTCATLACNSGFGDCDGNVDNGCETTLNSLTHCGACNVACALANATESCASGACTLGTCSGGYGNCDFSATNGCETALTSNNNCNACGALCDYVNAGESCSTGSCTLGTCSAGFASCDNNDGNGCEQPLSTNAHCGDCNVACSRANASASCSTGSCTLGACNAGFASCDGNATNGCETSTSTTANCGGCASLGQNQACTGLPNVMQSSCGSGTCTIDACNSGFSNCDGNLANGCETATSACYYSQTITIQNTTGTALTNHQVLINLADSNPIFAATHLASAAGNDIRIVQSDGTTAVPYWIETLSSSVAASKGRIWVKVTVAANSSVSVYLRYGLQANASSPLSDIHAVMEWGDDFSGAANTQVSATYWNGTRPGTNIAALSGSGELLWKNTGTKTTGRLSATYIATAATQAIIQETKMRTVTKAANGVMGGGFYSALNDNFGALIDGSTADGVDYYYNNGAPTGFGGSVMGVDYRLTLQAFGTTCSDMLTNYATGAVVYNFPSIAHTVANDRVTIGFMYEDATNLINQVTDTRFDWILVRKYTATPPTVTVPAVETNF